MLINSCRRFVSFCRSQLALGQSTLALCGLLMPLIVAAASFTLPAVDRVRIFEPPRSVSDTELTDQNGDLFSLHSLHGRVALVLFGFTNCDDVCPAGMQLMQMLERSQKFSSDEVAYVLISVDGERDTPDVMNAFLKKFSPEFIGLTADPSRIKPIAKEFSATFYKGHTSEGHQPGYDVSHSPQIFVLDTNGLLRAEFYSPSIDSMATIVSVLLDESDRASSPQQNP